MNPDTIDRNYQSHIGLLRQDYQDRDSGKEILLKQAQLLGISPETITANVQWHNDLRMSSMDGILLGTKPQTKREKLAWILREVFEYRRIAEEDKKPVIKLMYDFVRHNPKLILDSINTLERKKEKIKQKMSNYLEELEL
ncbi:MAG TPA: hypothetical protein VJC39_01440 [Candidatus Nanoarchaeia archaeon]|nr:hypothetical protein [Candidatus Nanoarchaeia archaeon]